MPNFFQEESKIKLKMVWWRESDSGGVMATVVVPMSIMIVMILLIVAMGQGGTRI
jgi:hypothetical protein